MNTEYLESFVAAVDCGSLAEAARRLDVTAAALAARVHALETDLDMQLLKRAGRVVKATEAGLKILEPARALLRDERNLRVIASDGARVGELRLGAFVSALTNVLPPVLKNLYARYPELALFITPGASVELCRKVGSGELDAAVVVEPQFAIRKTCEWRPFLDEPLVVVAPAAMAGRDAHEVLRNEPFIRYERSVLGGQLADRYLRDHQIHPHQRLEIDGLLAIAALVDQGIGVSLLPDWVSLWSSGMALARLPLPGRAPVRRSGLIWASNGPHASLARDFFEEAKTIFGTARPVARGASRGG